MGMALQKQCSLWHSTYLITKSSNVARRLYVQANGRLIGPELFSISTGGDAVKKSYISMEGLFSSWDLCKRKNGLHHWKFRWIHLCIISTPSSSAVLIEGHAVRSAFVFSMLSFPFSPRLFLKLHCTVRAWNLPILLAQINPRRLSTCNRPHTAQGHMHLFHFFLRGPNIQRHII